MSASTLEQAVAAHYGQGDLTERIVKALGADNAKPLTLSDLAKVDQLHHGGLRLTERLADRAGIGPGMRVLDAGSGIGGAARFLASVCGCQVEAIDLTPEFVRTGAALDALVGLSENISHRVGSVTNFPYENNRFDVVWSQNVTMNIADKAAMFAESLRVLRPGGVFAFTHLAGGNGAAPDYPLPWAMTAETSFSETPSAIFKTLEESGFENVRDHASGKKPSAAPPPPNDGPDGSVVMGEDMPTRQRNAILAASDGRLVPMMVTARRPA